VHLWAASTTRNTQKATCFSVKLLNELINQLDFRPALLTQGLRQLIMQCMPIWDLDFQKQFASGATALELSVSLSRIFKFVNVMDTDLDLAI